jgi:hypothetical protein
MQKHSHLTPEGRAFWYTERLWELARDLPVVMIAIADIPEFDHNCWFGEPPTYREVAEHARQIMEADLDFPIILSSDGQLMDGGHRIAKAWLSGETDVKAQRFERDPEPDYIIPND